MFSNFGNSSSNFGSSAAPNTGGFGSGVSGSNFGGNVFGASGATPSTTAMSSNPFGHPITPSSSSLASTPGSEQPYSITVENENGTNIKMLCIAAMPAYRNRSGDEIRVEDYARGRKGPASYPGNAPGAFSTTFSSGSGIGTSSMTSSAAPSSGFGTFGTGGMFGGSSGMPAATPSSSSPFGTSGLFGATTGPAASTATSAFGAPSAFGTATTAPSIGGFGQQQGAFGSTTAAKPFGAFGSSAPFGGPSSAGATSNIFGSASSAAPTPFGASASAAPTPGAFGAGAAPSAMPGFGQSGFGGFGTSAPSTAFGQQQQQPVGSTAPSPFGSQPTTSIFGSSAAAAPPAAPSVFGGSTSSGMFGRPAGAAFGQPQQPQTTGPFGTGASSTMFGQPQAQPQQQPPSVFGQPQQTPPSAFGGFGSAGTGLGGFAPNAAIGAPKPATASSAFSFLPSSTTGLNPQHPTSTFGTLSTSTPSSAATPAPGSMFGMNPQSATASSNFPSTPFSFNKPFGTAAASTAPAAPGLFGSAFPAASAATAASLSAAPATMAFPAVSGMAQPLGTAPSSLSIKPPLPMGSLPPAAAPSKTVSAQEPAATAHKFTPRSSFRLKGRDISGPVPVFSIPSGSAAMGASTVLVPRKVASASSSLKKLIVTDLEGAKAMLPTPFAPHSALATPSAVRTAPPSTPVKSNFLSTAATPSLVLGSLRIGDTYTLPPLEVLRQSEPSALKRVSNFVVGQKGFGQIRFLAPVDLTGIDLDRLFDGIVQFGEGEAVLYADPECAPKAEAGEGLNVPAEIRIERVWAHPNARPGSEISPDRVRAITDKLRAQPGTHFVDYDAGNGVWTFTVDHF